MEIATARLNVISATKDVVGSNMAHLQQHHPEMSLLLRTSVWKSTKSLVTSVQQSYCLSPGEYAQQKLAQYGGHRSWSAFEMVEHLARVTFL